MFRFRLTRRGLRVRVIPGFRRTRRARAQLNRHTRRALGAAAITVASLIGA